MSFNCCYLDYVFRLCYSISSFRSRFTLASTGSTTTSLRQKWTKYVSVYMYLRGSPFPGKVIIHIVKNARKT